MTFRASRSAGGFIFKGIGLVLAIGSLALAVALGGCDEDAPRRRVRLTAGPATPPPAAIEEGGRVLRIGVASVLSPPESVGRYRDLIDYLGEALGVATEMVQRPSYAEMNELLHRRYCTAAFLCNYASVRAESEFGAEPIAAPVVRGKTSYRAYIIVRRDAAARSVLDLAGRRFGFADPMCNAGWLYPSFRVVQLGRDPARFFGSEIFTYSYENSIQAVAEGIVDAAGVEAPLYDRLIAERDPAALRTRVVDRSPPVGTPPVVVPPGIDPGLRERLREFFFTLHESARGREILAAIDVDRFVEANPVLYAPVRAMAKAMERP